MRTLKPVSSAEAGSLVIRGILGVREFFRPRRGVMNCGMSQSFRIPKDLHRWGWTRKFSAAPILAAVTAGVLIVNTGGCAGSTSQQMEKVPAAQPTFDIISPQAQTLTAIEKMPTTFTVSPYDDRESWGRAKTFLKQFTQDGLQAEEEGADRIVLSNHRGTRSSKDRDLYTYRIEKRFLRGEISYAVSCRPVAGGATRALALRNAKNVARFVRDGDLEVSVLAR